MLSTRYFVVDIDDTAYSYTSDRDDYLSQPIIDMAVRGEYKGFYGCTHRGYSTINFLKLRTIRAAFSAKALDGFPTYRVMENFARATSLPLEAVSTLDDVTAENVEKGVGYGYENILKPYEQEGKWADGDISFQRKRDAITYPSNKNPQLLQIAQHAARKHPGETVILDYVDDNKDNCGNALTAMQQTAWPKGVYLRVHRYVNREIELLEGSGQPCTPLRANSLFASTGMTSPVRPATPRIHQ